MAVTRWAAVVDAVLAALRADATVLTLGAQVVDGPPDSLAAPLLAVYVGWTGDVDNDTAGTVSQQYHDAGVAAKRDETCEVFCTVQSVRGDGDMSAARRDAVLVLGAIESALRGNISLGLEDLIRIEVSNGDVRQVRDAEGIGVEFDITITSTALI